MRQLTELLPNIARVCAEIDADNGAHHAERLFPGRVRSIEERLRDCVRDAVLPLGEGTLTLIAWDKWLETLSDEEIITIAAGEEKEIEDLIKNCPRPGLHEFLCAFFEAETLKPAPEKTWLELTLEFFTRIGDRLRALFIPR